MHRVGAVDAAEEQVGGQHPDTGEERRLPVEPYIGRRIERRRLDVHDDGVRVGTPDRADRRGHALDDAEHHGGPSRPSGESGRPDTSEPGERGGRHRFVEGREVIHDAAIALGEPSGEVGHRGRVSRVGEGVGEPGRGAVVHEVGDDREAETGREGEALVEHRPVELPVGGVRPRPLDAVAHRGGAEIARGLEVVAPGVGVPGEVVLVERRHPRAGRRVDAGVLDAREPREAAGAQVAVHFSPVVATPATKNFCAKKNAMAIGMSDRVAPASRIA